MKKFSIITLALLVSMTLGFTVNRVSSQTNSPALVTAPAKPTVTYTEVDPLDIVATPQKYLNKNIKIQAKFDKFSTLGLDYPPAMRSSEKYISFLIQRPDVTNHNIPLSELKIFLKKEIAEKNIDLDAGDIVSFTGRVFSSALGDAWMDVDSFNVISKKDKKSEENK